MSEPFSAVLSRYMRLIRSSPRRTAVVLLILLLVIALIALGMWFIAQQNRSLAVLNWLNLLIIPAFLVLAAIWLSNSWRRTQLEVARSRDERAMIESYFDRLTDLLLSRNLRQASTEDEAARAARAHTLTIFRQLDGEGRPDRALLI